MVRPHATSPSRAGIGSLMHLPANSRSRASIHASGGDLSPRLNRVAAAYLLLVVRGDSLQFDLGPERQRASLEGEPGRRGGRVRELAAPPVVDISVVADVGE